jgi:outer membrane immunogenic protein
MKQLLITITAISMMAASTVAGACADLKGFYAGGNIGLGTYKSSWTDHAAWLDSFSSGWAPGTVTTSSTGFTGGVQGGYNVQQGCALFGVEMDANMANFDSKENYSPTAAGATSLTLHSQLNWYTTVRARAGVIVDSLMLYVTGGLVYADNEQSWSANDSITSATERFSKDTGAWGMTGGVGMEWALSPRVSIIAEGLYMSFVGNDTSGYSASANRNVLFDTDYAMFTGRIGANVKF